MSRGAMFVLFCMKLVDFVIVLFLHHQIGLLQIFALLFEISTEINQSQSSNIFMYIIKYVTASLFL
jgi:hypothetical protein